MKTAMVLPWQGRSSVGRANQEKRRTGIQRTTIIDTSASSISPYADYARQGAVLVPRCLFFVQEAENPTIVQAGQTVTINPRRGSQDKEPWRSLDLTEITSQNRRTQTPLRCPLGGDTGSIWHPQSPSRQFSL